MVEKVIGLTFKPQLSVGIINNLTKAIPIKTKESSHRRPFYYNFDSIIAVAQFCLENETLYSTPSFKANISFYLDTFIESLRQTNNNYENSVFSDQGHSPKKDRHRVFFHGRSNGFPTPLGIMAFQIARKLYPQSEILFGVDHDESSIYKGQLPFIDPQFRASCYLVPKIVDSIIYLHPPSDKIEKRIYWNGIYSPDGSLQPDVIVIPDDELNGTKKENSGKEVKVLSFSEIFDIEEYNLFTKIHQTNLKNCNVSLDDLSLAWKIINDLKI